MIKYWKSFLSLIFPDLCYGCDNALVEGEEKLCLRCFRDLPITDYHRQKPNPMMETVTETAKVKGAYCYLKFNQNGKAQRLLHELKYHNNIAIGTTLGKWFGNYMATEMSRAKIDYIVPLPMHKIKQRKRGYNQSEVIAKGIEGVTGIPVLPDVLIRTKNISTQTKKGRIERWHNTRDVYKVKNEDLLKGKNILLLDDVITTGATIGSALEVLANTQSNAIYFGCIASGK